MTTGRVRSSRLARSLLAGPVMVVALLGFADLSTPTARADAIDNAFLNAVKAHGIDFASAQAAIVAGHEVCDELDTGKQESDVASTMMTNSNLDGYRAGFFVGVAVAAYCPRHRSTS